MGGSRSFAYNPDVEQWIGEIRGAKKTLGIDDSKYPDALILALIHVETSGKPFNRRSGSQYYGLLQQGTDNAREIGLPDGSPNHGKGYVAIYNFLRWMELPSKRKNHEYVPEYIALIWKGGGGTLRSYKRIKKSLGIDAARQYLADWGKGKSKGSPLIYLSWFQNALELWISRTGETNIAALQDDFSAYTIPTRSENDTFWGQETSVRSMTPFELGSYVTPEELRKGIIAQFYYINEWHLTKLASSEAEDVRKEKESDQNMTPIESLDENAGLEASFSSDTEKKEIKGIRGDNLVDERRRYAQALVEAEFYRRRFANRSVPVVTGPFNPYPVAGFPGLLMTPGRPIIGYISNVSHTISVSGGSGSTAVTMVSPRYWDEGEVWYWFGGLPHIDPVMRNFPQWHNREVVPTNNTAGDFFERPKNLNGEVFLSRLDRFYQFMLGVPSIEYQSNSTGIANPEVVTSAIRDRNPGNLEVKEETLDPKEYNKAIATLDENGRFAPGTLAHKFYGHIKPYDTSEANATVDSQIDYVERYGASERELLIDFLGNSFSRVEGSDKLVVTGPTFGGDKINAIQNQILEYMKDLEKRNLKGGV